MGLALFGSSSGGNLNRHTFLIGLAGGVQAYGPDLQPKGDLHHRPGDCNSQSANPIAKHGRIAFTKLQGFERMAGMLTKSAARHSELTAHPFCLQKRHHTRFFTTDRRDSDRSGNPLPGGPPARRSRRRSSSSSFLMRLSLLSNTDRTRGTGNPWGPLQHDVFFNHVGCGGGRDGGRRRHLPPDRVRLLPALPRRDSGCAATTSQLFKCC